MIKMKFEGALENYINVGPTKFELEDKIQVDFEALSKNVFGQLEPSSLKKAILEEIENCGFVINGNKLEHKGNKEDIRKLHQLAVQSQREKYKEKLRGKEPELLNYIANGKDIDPHEIKPELVYVDSKTEHWDLFRYIKLHWSIPISNGYGRRLCYVIFDKNNDKVIGILGLADPVYSTGIRDHHIGWNAENKKKQLKKVMDGFVIGAVPPYNQILGGKLVASLLCSNQVRNDFKNKYAKSLSYISKTKHTGELAIITTLSALGKSSLYDRISLPNGQKFISVGYSKGWGEFHFYGDTYNQMKELVSNQLGASKKHKNWGTGFKNKREVVEKTFKILGIPKGIGKHGINREQYVIPLAKNYREALQGKEEPEYYNLSTEDISEYMKNRWMIPRSKRKGGYKEWKKENYQLWNEI